MQSGTACYQQSYINFLQLRIRSAILGRKKKKKKKKYYLKKDFSYKKNVQLLIAYCNILSFLLIAPSSMSICAIYVLDFIDPVAKTDPLLYILSFQAALFFLSGILVMTGCMTLIILDWIHTDASDGH